MKLVKDAAWLFLGNALSRLASGLFTVALARYVGIDNYGVFVLGLSVAAITAQIADFGLQQNYIRLVSGGWHGERESLDSVVFWIRLLLGAGACVVTAVFVCSFVARDFQYPVIALCVPYVIAQTVFNFRQGVLMASHQMRSAAVQRIFNALLSVFLAASTLMIIGGDGLSSLAVNGIYGGAAFAAVFLLQKKVPRLVDAKIFASNLKVMFSGLGGFFWTGLLYVVGPQAPILILQYVGEAVLLGVFAFIYRLPLVLYMVPMSIVQSFYPKLIAAKGDLEKYKGLVKVEIASVVGVGVAMTLMLDFASPVVLDMVSDKSMSAFSGVGMALEVMSWLIVVQATSIPFAHVLMTTGFQGRRAMAQGTIFLAAAPVFYFLSRTENVVVMAGTVVCFEMAALLLYGCALRLSHGREMVWFMTKLIIPYLSIALLVKVAQILLESDGNSMVLVRPVVLLLGLGGVAAVFYRQTILKRSEA